MKHKMTFLAEPHIADAVAHECFGFLRNQGRSLLNAILLLWDVESACLVSAHACTLPKHDMEYAR